MGPSLQTISLAKLAIAFLPIALLLLVMFRWRAGAATALYANARMLVQLLAIGYVLTFIFETDEPLVVVGVVSVMLTVSAWIALRPIRSAGLALYPVALGSIAGGGLAVLALVTQLVLDLPRWFEPSFVIPLGGIIFNNAMNTVSLAAERYDAEQRGGSSHSEARRVALDAALIPRVNSLLAVGLVSLPGMMSGQILSGVDPLVAVRYQIMVMCMIFGSGGLGAVIYLTVAPRGMPGTSPA